MLLVGSGSLEIFYEDIRQGILANIIASSLFALSLTGSLEKDPILAQPIQTRKNQMPNQARKRSRSSAPTIKTRLAPKNNKPNTNQTHSISPNKPTTRQPKPSQRTPPRSSKNHAKPQTRHHPQKLIQQTIQKQPNS